MKNKLLQYIVDKTSYPNPFMNHTKPYANLSPSPPHYFPSVSDRWFGEGRSGASISFQNRQEFLPTVLSPT